MTNCSIEKIKAYLKYDIDIEVLDTATSTNALLKERAEAGVREGTLLVTAMQTEGRGRLDRRFFSPKDRGLYFSFVVKPTTESGDFLTIVAAIATHSVIEKYSPKTIGIKWINDIYADGKKCAGILVEGSRNIDNGSLKYAIVGIGINLYEPEGGYPDDIKNIATAMFDNATNHIDIENKIVAEIVNTFFDLFNNFLKDRVIAEYKSRLFILGKSVTVCKSDQEVLAKAIDIDREGRLVVRLEDGHLESLNCGEIRLRV